MNLDKIGRFYDYLSYDLLGGPRPLKLSWVINFQKAGTLIWVLGLAYYFDNFSTIVLVYAGLHGSYGFCWLLKDVTFPDVKWQTRVTVPSAIMSFVAILGLYWVIPFVLIAGYSNGASWPWVVLAIVLHTLGVAIMLVADAQKYYELKHRKGLITDGMFKWVRHPNYTGEMMIYGAYGVIVWHWIPWVILAWVWCGFFAINILRKECSMSRYPEWAGYKQRTTYIIPKLF